MNPKEPVSITAARSPERWHCPLCGAACSGTTTATDRKRDVVKVKFACEHQALIVAIKGQK